MVVVEAIKVNKTDDCSATEARGSATRTSARIQKIKSTQDAIRRRQREEEAIMKAEKPVKKLRPHRPLRDTADDDGPPARCWGRRRPKTGLGRPTPSGLT